MTGCSERSVQHGRHQWLVRELGTAGKTAAEAIMVPGLGSGEYLLPHAELLARSRRVLIPDMPGFGATPAPQRLRTIEEYGDALVELITGEATEPVDLLGNSFGTQIALCAAQMRPDLVRRLVLVGPTFDARARSYAHSLGRWLLTAPIEPPSLALSLARSYLKCGVRTPALAFRAAMKDRPEDRIAGLPHPILLVRGCRDRIAPGRWLRDLAGRAQHAEIAELPGVAHTVDYAAPARIAAITEAFLDRPG
ncbi:MAG TPA: alpha/beta hydrolase [Mycobacteriales bacterium]|nr:alpha/beta hydrolase [Mycobacteriales bacterium]